MPRRSAMPRFFNVTIRKDKQMNNKVMDIPKILDRLRGPSESRGEVIVRLVINEFKSVFPLEAVGVTLELKCMVSNQVEPYVYNKIQQSVGSELESTVAFNLA